MAIKTAAEMFGDGAGFGTQVPISFVNPSAYASGNRGVGFGEQLTSAVANRPHYELALNDEDLNTRLAVFEVQGLDGAYRLGAVATAGGGRVVDTDGGAVELRNDLTALHADDVANAMVRATTVNDTIPGSLGFDFVGGHLDPEEVSTGTEVAGFLHRRALGFASGPCLFTSAEPSRLNPGGALATTVRLTTGGQKFYTTAAGPTPPAGNYSNVSIGFDLLEISGSTGGTDDGVYLVTALGATEQDVTISHIDGTAVSLAADDTAPTVTLYRVHFATQGNASAFLMDDNTFGKGIEVAVGNELGSGNALSFHIHSEAGGLIPYTSYFDQFGRFNFRLTDDEMPWLFADAVDRSRYDGGAFATKVWRTGGLAGASQFSHIVASADDNLAGRLDYASLELANLAGTGVDSSIAFAYTASSPSNGELDVTTATMAGAWRDWLCGHFMLVEILTPAAEGGFYWLVSSTTGADRIFIKNLDGTTASDLPTTGTGTLRVFFTSFMGKRPNVAGIQALDGTLADFTPYNVLSAGEENDAAALTVFTPPTAVGADRAAIRAFTTNIGTGVTPYEIFHLLADGTMGIRGEYTYEYNRSRTVTFPIQHAQPEMDNSGNGLWYYGASGNAHWIPRTAGALALPLRFPRGAVVASVEVLLKPSGIRGSNNFSLSLHRRSLDWTAVIGAPSTDTIVLSGAVTFEEDDGTADYQVVTLAPNATLTISDTDEDTYYVGVTAPGTPLTGDFVYGYRVTYTDPGPRNH